MPLDGANYTEVDEIVALRNKMADYLEKNGWCQGAATMDKKRTCLTGAYFAVKYGDYDNWPVCIEIEPQLEKAMAAIGFKARRNAIFRPTAAHAAVDWNDTPGRTAGDVIHRLRFGESR